MTADQTATALLTTPDARLSQVPEAVLASQVQVGTHAVPERYLYAHALRGEVIQHVRTQASSADHMRLPAILADWDALRPKVQALEMAESGLADTIAIEPLPSEAEAFAAATLAEPLIANAFSAWNHAIAMVELGKLVFPQRTINDEYAGQLLRKYPASPDLDDLLKICVSPQAETTPIQHLELAPNTHVFSSPNTDLRFIGAFLKESIGAEDAPLVVTGGLPAVAVVGFVGYGTPVINAYLVGSRLILGNGHHRVYVLGKLGITTIPVLVVRVSNPLAEMPPAIGGTPRELCLVPRPPLAKDFQDEDLSVTLQVKQRIRQLTIAMNTNQYDIPT